MRNEKQKMTYFDHFGKKYYCDTKYKRIWIAYLKKSANKKYRRLKKEEIYKEIHHDCN